MSDPRSNIMFLQLSNDRYIALKGPLYDLLQRYDNHLIKTALCDLDQIAPSGVINSINKRVSVYQNLILINTDPLFATVEFMSLIIISRMVMKKWLENDYMLHINKKNV